MILQHGYQAFGHKPQRVIGRGWVGMLRSAPSNVVAGPYYIDASQAYAAGSQSAQAYVAGSQAGGFK
jgi:hypothetical protein